MPHPKSPLPSSGRGPFYRRKRTGSQPRGQVKILQIPAAGLAVPALGDGHLGAAGHDERLGGEPVHVVGVEDKALVGVDEIGLPQKGLHGHLKGDQLWKVNREI